MHQTAPPLTAPPTHRRTPWWAWAVALLVVAGLTWAVVARVRSVRAAAGDSGGGKRRGGADRAVPVVTATARRGVLPVYLYGLGTVTPLKTVTLRSRVDGAITAIHYAEGQQVKVGQPLVQIDDRPYRAALDQAQGQLARDQAALTAADWNVKQDREAIATRAISEQQLHTDQAALDGAHGAMLIDRANIDAARANVDYCHITSPIDGTIGLRQTDAGNLVRAGDATPLATITQLHPISVVFTLPEDELAAVRRRMTEPGPVAVDAYDRTLRRRLAAGRLVAIDSAIDPATLTIRCRAEYDNADGSLYPNQAVNARVRVDTVRDAVLVPTAAVQHGPDGPYVYVAGGGVAHVRPVTTGATLTAVGAGEADTTAVTIGLHVGDAVVVDGVDKLADGTKVAARPEAATRPATDATRRSAK